MCFEENLRSLYQVLNVSLQAFMNFRANKFGFCLELVAMRAEVHPVILGC